MKKFKTVLTIIVLAIMATAMSFVSCKKDPTPATTHQSKSTLTRIKDFKRQLETVKANPDERSLSYMSIPDAVWNLEALFNYTYALPCNSYGQTICCDTTLYMPVCNNDSVSLVDLYLFNGQMYEAVLTLYQAAVLDNKRFIILDVESGERNETFQTVKLHTVQGSLKGNNPQPEPPQPWRPFVEGVIWYYGGDNANSMGYPADAADTLTGMLNANLVPKAPEGYTYTYTGVMNKNTVLGENHPNPFSGYPTITPRYCEFYKENPAPGDYLLNSDQMNYYYFGERHLVLNILPNSAAHPITSDHSLFRVIVEDAWNDTAIGHHTTAYYGIPILISQDSVHLWDL